MLDFKSLPPRELEILHALWAQDEPVSAMQLHHYMQKNWRVQTLITHLNRMVAKDAVKMEQILGRPGARYYYSANIPQKEYLLKAAQSFVQNHYDNDAEALIKDLLATGVLNITALTKFTSSLSGAAKDGE